MDDFMITKDCFGNEIRAWQDINSKEDAPVIFLCTIDDNGDYSIPKLNLEQTIKVRNRLDSFIYKHTNIPTKETMAKEARLLNAKLRLLRRKLGMSNDGK